MRAAISRLSPASHRRTGRRTPPRTARLAGGALLAACLLTGCTQLGPAERESLQMAAQLYARGDTTGAMTRLDRLIAEHNQAVEIAEAYYVRGLCRARNGQTQAAMTDFNLAVNRSKRADLTARALASMAALEYKAGNWARAADLYGRAIPGLPDTPPTDTIVYSAAVASQRAGRWTEAQQRFADVLNRFRDRPIAALARPKAQWRYPYFSIQLGAYRSMNSAQASAAAWRQKGFETVVEALPRNGQVLWVVMTGRYPTYAEAQTALSRVRAQVRDAVIIP